MESDDPEYPRSRVSENIQQQAARWAFSRNEGYITLLLMACGLAYACFGAFPKMEQALERLGQKHSEERALDRKADADERKLDRELFQRLIEYRDREKR